MSLCSPFCVVMLLLTMLHRLVLGRVRIQAKVHLMDLTLDEVGFHILRDPLTALIP